MDGNFIPLVTTTPIDGSSTASSTERIVDFYENASHDYAHWSRGLNMHLGFYRWGMNPFDRESMLEQMNLEVARRLAEETEPRRVFLDLGCGAGSISRTVAGCFPNSIIKGFTLAPVQVGIASEMNAAGELDKRIDIRQGNFTDLPVVSRSADGAWAVESACYAGGSRKNDLICEIARVLKPGGRFVVADCFLKVPEAKLNPVVRRAYRVVCDSWALTDMPIMGEFVRALEGNGFGDVTVEDISWRTAPSLAHAPFAVLSFLIKKLLAREPLTRHSINNVKASLLALLLGSNRSGFSYCLITSTLREHEALS